MENGNGTTGPVGSRKPVPLSDVRRRRHVALGDGARAPAVERRGPAAPVYATGRPLRQADGTEAGGTPPPRNPLEGLPPILTPADLANLFQFEGRPDKVVWRLQRAGLRVIRLGRQARVLRSDLEKFLDLGE